ncbi:MAG: signal peptide peptidase SppA [Gammaproteobacteria bacterium]
MNFIKSIFSWLGRFLEKARTVLLNLGTAFVLILITIAILGIFSSSDKKVDPSGKVLIFNPEGIVVDQEALYSDTGFSGIFSENVEQIQIRDLLRLIENIKADEQLAGVLLDFSDTGFAGPTTLLKVTEAIHSLTGSGKEIIVHQDRMLTSDYLLSAAADEIWIHQSGAFNISGIGGYGSYNKRLLENLKLTIHNYAQGDFKSAVEGTTRESMSENDRLQRNELLIPIWEAMKIKMAYRENIQPQDIQYFADNYFSYIPEAAFANIKAATDLNLINGSKSYPEFRNHMIEKFGLNEDGNSFNSISLNDYKSLLKKDSKKAEDTVVVITAEGAISEGSIMPGVVGSDELVEIIQNAHESKSTKAIVLRVNSPGGSIIASEMIADELMEAKRKGIPIVVSMGDYAASGGVYISTPADYIFAEPTSITGSIGVAIAFPTAENSFDFIGMDFDGVVTSKYAGWDVNLPIDESLDAKFAQWGNDAYTKFISLVANSRNKTFDEIKAIAGGRVWIGAKALELGLIDELGDINAATAKAAVMASLDEYKVVYAGQELSPEALLIREIQKQFDIKISNTKTYVYSTKFLEFFNDVLDKLTPSASYTCSNCLVEIN